MRTAEALTHQFLASDSSSCRRRENIRYPSTRLRRTAERRFRQQIELQTENGLARGPSVEKQQNGNKSPILTKRKNPLQRHGSADFIPRTIKT